MVTAPFYTLHCNQTIIGEKSEVETGLQISCRVPNIFNDP